MLKPGFAASDALAAEIRPFVRDRLSAAEYPREIAFVDEIPLTTTGKVIRRIFRERVAKKPAADRQPNRARSWRTFARAAISARAAARPMRNNALPPGGPRTKVPIAEPAAHRRSIIGWSAVAQESIRIDGGRRRCAPAPPASAARPARSAHRPRRRRSSRCRRCARRSGDQDRHRLVADPQRIDPRLAGRREMRDASRANSASAAKRQRRAAPALPAGRLQRQELLEARSARRRARSPLSKVTGPFSPSRRIWRPSSLRRLRRKPAARSRRRRRAPASPAVTVESASGRPLRAASAASAAATGPSSGRSGTIRLAPNRPAPARRPGDPAAAARSSPVDQRHAERRVFVAQRRTAGAMRPRRVRVNGASAASAPERECDARRPRPAPSPRCSDGRHREIRMEEDVVRPPTGRRARPFRGRCPQWSRRRDDAEAGCRCAVAARRSGNARDRSQRGHLSRPRARRTRRQRRHDRAVEPEPACARST